MARLVESVYTHVPAANERIDWAIDEEQWGPNEIPALFPAVKALTGPVTRLLSHVSRLYLKEPGGGEGVSWTSDKTPISRLTSRIQKSPQ